MLRLSAYVVSACFWPLLSQAAPLGDLVDHLPHYGRPPTPHFSGYLNATAGCDVATNGECFLHYWMAMAEEDPWTKPVVLWLNGGPGSTSLLGFLQELGPLLINATGGLMDNPYAWTKQANVIALEAPVGVGYSFCGRQVKGKVCKNTDKYTASASRAALQDFFSDKFPELRSNEFFITGESYAGVYIPTLAKEILDNTDVNLKGVAVGDPCTDNTAQRDSMDSLWYSNKYGLMDEQIYDRLWNQCNARMPTLMVQGGIHLVAAQLNEELQNELKRNRVLRGKDASGDIKNTLTLNQQRQIAYDLLDARILRSAGSDFLADSPECILAYRKYMMSTSHGLSQSWKDLYIDDYSLFAPVSDQQDDDMYKYMSRSDVQKALHVEGAPVDDQWPNPPVGFDYTKEYDACNAEASPDAPSMIDFYKELVPRLRAVWIYNGNADPCVSYEGTRVAVKRIGFPELDGGSYRPWFYQQSAASLQVLQERAPLFGPNLQVVDLGAQFAGHVANYEQGLAFVTFHGAGHMVPQFRPQAALHFLTKFLAGEQLAPLLPTNSSLAGLSNSDFNAVMKSWTEAAQSKPYSSDKGMKLSQDQEKEAAQA